MERLVLYPHRWLNRLDEFWNFPGAAQFANAAWGAYSPTFPGAPSSSPYQVREFPSFAAFRKYELNYGTGMLANHTCAP